ncbi:MAG: ORF6N domain-containing protein [Verrucomicrobia bacterium]|nr:ORF6N domain-containing protein [Verrucomicrobiota bacterium]
MAEKQPLIPVERLDNLIHEVRGEKVMLDSDLARLYGVTTKQLNRAMKRNADRFPADFVFQLTPDEVEAMRCQFGTASTAAGAPIRSQIATASKRNVRFLPYAFTEHGAIMAANVLNSPRAAQMSVFVVRAFIAMRRALADSRGQARKLAALEKELKERLDVHETAIVTILQRVMDIIDPPPPPPHPPRRQIGFQVKEKSASYLVRSGRNARSRNHAAFRAKAG